MNTLKKILAIASLFLFLFTPHFAFSTGTEKPGEKKGPEPIQIEADQMLSNQKDNSVVFSGKVEAEQGDVIIHADEMTVYYVKKNVSAQNQANIGGKNPRNIQRLWARGHVKISKGEWVATGDTAEYFENERKVVLVGNTRVWQNNNLITGDTFTMYLDEGKSIVERSTKKNERVKAFFYPDSDKKK